MHEGPKHNQPSAHKQYPITLIMLIIFSKKKKTASSRGPMAAIAFGPELVVDFHIDHNSFLCTSAQRLFQYTNIFLTLRSKCAQSSRLLFFVPHSSSQLLRHTLASAVHCVGLFCSTDAVIDEPWRTGNFTAGLAGLWMRIGRRIHFQCVL